jgi:hypothetical protein
MQKKKSYNLFVVIAFLALAFPMLKGFVTTDKNPHLTGIVINNVNPDSLFKSGQWFSGEYQTLKDDYNNDHWAFKELFVRLNNQLYYDLYRAKRITYTAKAIFFRLLAMITLAASPSVPNWKKRKWFRIR